MSINYKVLARLAYENSLKVRLKTGYELFVPVNIYDLVEKIGLEVRFHELPSFEGMYVKDKEIILVSSLRPAGRQAYTCAHELGHHVFNHGSLFDLIENDTARNAQKNEEEFLADCFAGFLLMPKLAIDKAFASRGIRPNCSTPVDIFTLAGYFGVGYSTLINHMTYSLHVLERTKAQRLLKTTPKLIKTSLLGEEPVGNVVKVDSYWEEQSVDIQVDDNVLCPEGTYCEGESIQQKERKNGFECFAGTKQGVSRLINKQFNWSVYVRVSRFQYTGRSVFRHLEEE